jgi:diguanylate cyclase (GGDEF)-like protein
MATQRHTTKDRPWPQTRSELDSWIRAALRLTPADETNLMRAIDTVFSRYQALWEASKEEAMQALSVGFADKVNRLRTELSARDATVNSISQYFEELVAGLTDRSHRDPKTKLMNFDWFMSTLQSFLELEQRVRWCAIGLVDITAFKWFNDALGHAVGDLIIERVARILREQVRSDDMIGKELGLRPSSPDLHARFGGDEFCFLIPDLATDWQAWTIAERFRRAVEQFDWASVGHGLGTQPVRVDVGVVCLWMGPIIERRAVARRLALDLIDQADRLMYHAKGADASRVSRIRMEIRLGRLVEIPEGQSPATPAPGVPTVEET